MITLFGWTDSTNFYLGGVLWTLKLEIFFYSIFAISLLLFPKKSYMVIIFLVIGYFFSFTYGGFPLHGGFRSYFTIFIPVFIGGMAFGYLKTSRLNTLAFCCLFLFSFFLHLLAILTLRNDLVPFASSSALACLTFTVLYLNRTNFRIGLFLINLSNLTYPVYLYHNWFFFEISSIISFKLNLNRFDALVSCLSLIVFFFIMFCLNYLVSRATAVVKISGTQKP
jgi:peptidoglycan/LPS O-acetylase OafA/YrhL